VRFDRATEFASFADKPAVLLFEHDASAQHGAKFDGIRVNIASHVADTVPCGPPDLIARRNRQRFPLGSFDVGLERCANRTRRVSPHPFGPIAGQFRGIDRCRANVPSRLLPILVRPPPNLIQ